MHLSFRAFFVLALCASAWSREKPLVAIILSDSASGPAYVQVSDFLLNGKREVHICGGQPLDNSAYRKLPKGALRPGMVLERESAGGLVLVSAAARLCVVPGNLKLAKGQAYTPKDLAEQAVVTGKLVSKSVNASESIPPNIPTGRQIHLLEAPDTELAEFLRAGRAQSIPAWSEYLRQFPSGAHVEDARRSLAAVFVTQGEGEFAAYKKNLDYAALKRARAQAQEARRVLPSSASASALLAAVEVELQRTLAAARQELDAYVQALSHRTAGYDHLKRSKSQLEQLLTADPSYPGADALNKNLSGQEQALEAALASAESSARDKNFDQAYAAVERYRAFAGEVPRVGAIIEQASRDHRTRGREFGMLGNWERAIAEFRRALDYRPDSATSELLQQAEAALEAARDRYAVQKAIDDAAALAAGKQFIEAYQTLQKLPDRQRALVTEQMELLKNNYVQDLLTRASALVRIHVPIRGRADEDAARLAHSYLEQAVKLTDQASTHVQLELVADRISEYYLKQAQRMLAKPRGSGIGLGWLLLKEGERYKPDHEQIRNYLTNYAPEFETRAKLSLAIRFRDQTSRRESVGFADQLADAVASGLENSGLPGIKILAWRERPQAESASDAASVGNIANFQVLGNIVQHRVEKKIERQSNASRYRAGYREVKNPAWVEGRRALDAAQQEYGRVQAMQQAQLPRMKKKEIEESNRTLEVLAKEVETARAKLDGIAETEPQEIVQPYNYIRQTVQLNAVVEVGFRIADPLSAAPASSDNVRVEIPKSVVLLENVKPEDVDGVVEEGVPPDEHQLLADAELEAQIKLMAKLIDRLVVIPGQVLEGARVQVARGDPEAAAEKYVLFLNSAPAKASERTEAENFLRKEFNVGPGSN